MIYKPFTNKSTPIIIEDIRECLKEDLQSQVTIDTWDLAHLIGEIERLNNDIKELLKENENKEKVIKAQDNIIKEVREYIMSELITEWDIKNGGHVSGSDLPVEVITPILKILDKENNNE